MNRSTALHNQVDSVLPADWRRPVRRARTCMVQGRGASGRRGSQRTSMVTSARSRMAKSMSCSSENRSRRPRRRFETRAWSVRSSSAAISCVQPSRCCTTACATASFSAGIGLGRGDGCTTDNGAAVASACHRHLARRSVGMPTPPERASAYGGAGESGPVFRDCGNSGNCACGNASMASFEGELGAGAPGCQNWHNATKRGTVAAEGGSHRTPTEIIPACKGQRARFSLFGYRPPARSPVAAPRA